MESIDLRHGLVIPELLRAAPQDLSLVAGAYPFEASKSGIFLKNNNTTRGIVASIRIDGASNARVESLGRTTTLSRWPVQFEARVAPGSTILLGPAQVEVWKSMTGINTDLELVNQIFTIEGAYYRDPPYPSDPAPESFIHIYTINVLDEPTEVNKLELLVNLHHSRIVTINVTPSIGSTFSRTPSVKPGLQSMLMQTPQPYSWKVNWAKYYP
jgi:hypothetical protein